MRISISRKKGIPGRPDRFITIGWRGNGKPAVINKVSGADISHKYKIEVKDR